MYHINGKDYVTEVLPGQHPVEHKYFAHYYPLANGDLYLVTTEGRIMFIDADDEEPKCVWEPKHGLAPRYYQPITPVFSNSGLHAVCEEEYRGPEEYGNARIPAIQSTRPMSEDCLCILTSALSCLIFRKGVIIYDGHCDMRGLPKIETRGGPMTGNLSYEVKQEYQWSKDEKGKYLGTGIDKDKTWDWVNAYLPGLPQNTQVRHCREYAISQMSGKAHVHYGQWYIGCERYPDGGSYCNQTTITPDRGEFAKHYTNRIWWSCCAPDPTTGKTCVNSLEEGLEYVDKAMINSAQLLDYQDGYVLVPLKHGVQRFKQTTLLGAVPDASALPGVTDNAKLNELDQEELDAYTVTVHPSLCPSHNGNNVVRMGIQFNDIFRVGETDDYYKYTFNGWKLHKNSFWKDHQCRMVPEYLLITPKMKSSRSAHKRIDSEGRTQCSPEFNAEDRLTVTCEPLFKLRGTNIQRCGNWFVSSEKDPERAGHYIVFNMKANNGCGLFREGIGTVSVSCVACWAIIRTHNPNGTTTIEVLSEDNLNVIWSVTLSQGELFGISNVTGSDKENGVGGYFYMYIRHGDQVTVLCCDAHVGTWTVTPVGQVSTSYATHVLFQEFAVVYVSTSETIVIRGCNVVWTGCGKTPTTSFGIPNAFVKTCYSTGYACLSRNRELWRYSQRINGNWDIGRIRSLDIPHCRGSYHYQNICGFNRNIDGTIDDDSRCSCQNQNLCHDVRLLTSDPVEAGIAGYLSTGVYVHMAQTYQNTYLAVDLLTGETFDYYGWMHETHVSETSTRIPSVPIVRLTTGAGVYPNLYCIADREIRYPSHGEFPEPQPHTATNNAQIRELPQDPNLSQSFLTIDPDEHGNLRRVYFRIEVVRCNPPSEEQTASGKVHFYMVTPALSKVEKLTTIDYPAGIKWHIESDGIERFPGGITSYKDGIIRDCFGDRVNHIADNEMIMAQPDNTSSVRLCESAGFWDQVNPKVAGQWEFGLPAPASLQVTAHFERDAGSYYDCLATRIDSYSECYTCTSLSPIKSRCQDLEEAENAGRRCSENYYLHPGITIGLARPIMPRVVTVMRDGEIRIDNDGGRADITVFPYPTFAWFDEDNPAVNDWNNFCMSSSNDLSTSEPRTDIAAGCIGGQLRCGAFTLGGNRTRTLSYKSKVIYAASGGLTSGPTGSIVSCCTARTDEHSTQGNDAVIVAFTDGNAVTERLFINEKEIASQSYNTTTYISISRINACRCGFVLAQIGTQHRETGAVDYSLQPDWFDHNGTTVWSVMGWERPGNPDDRINQLRFQCCDGYGLAMFGKEASPKITYGDRPYYSSTTGVIMPTTPTTCELDDGTVATGAWNWYTTRDCDESNLQYWFYINHWTFTGSDGNTRTVPNTWEGNPNAFVTNKGANRYVPFAWNKPATKRAVYRLIEGKRGNVLLNDSDITSMSCNFYNHDTFNYDGADVRTTHNDLSFELAQSYQWPPVACEPHTVIDRVQIMKSIPSIFMIDDRGYKRYHALQTPDATNKDSEKGKLTNITYSGAYEILEGVIRTHYNDDYTASGDRLSGTSKMEQPDRRKDQATPNYSAKNRAQIINDRERIHIYDRVPGYSKNYGTDFKTVSNPKMYNQTQKRSVWSTAGMMFILDKDLGVNAYNQYGELK